MGEVELRYPVLSDEGQKQTPPALEWEQCSRKKQRLYHLPFRVPTAHTPRGVSKATAHIREVRFRVVENGIAFRFGMRRDPGRQQDVGSAKPQ